MAESVDILQQRCIEANIAGAFHDALAKEYGAEKALAIVRTVIRKLAYAKGQELRMAHPEGNLVAIADLWATLSKGSALDIHFIEKSPECLRFRVTRCGYAEAYQKMGINPELGSLLSCERDEALLRGYSEVIEIERSDTIMDGAKFCEFCYRMKKNE